MAHLNDPVFDAEQAHLKNVHSELTKATDALKSKIDEIARNARADKSSMAEDIRPDFSDPSATLETLAAYESVNSVIKQYNIEQKQLANKLKASSLLLKKPYFAKLVIRFPGKNEPKEIYLGAVGFVDENHHHLVYDWRSPVAEVYYNQSYGKVSYEANGRTIEAILDLRRQFDIDHDKLVAYFDTDIALQDNLLIESLSQARTARMKEITATIQQEQNAVVRAPDTPAMLVSGVAGSGKTSVMLQRLAYLFFKKRNTLKPEDVVLITPNNMFQEYIEDVLPELGESNPRMHTWDSLQEEIRKPMVEATPANAYGEMLEFIENEFSKDEPAGTYLKAECVKYVLIDEVQDYTTAQLNIIASFYNRAHFLLLGDPNQALHEGLASFDEIRGIFEKYKGAVNKVHLDISYRSTAEITRLFASLANQETGFHIESAQRGGTKPKIIECEDNAAYAKMLLSEIEKTTTNDTAAGTTAVIVLQDEELEHVRSIAASLPTHEESGLATNLKLMTLQEAKGLEFDYVIMVDASSMKIDETDLWKRKLYTAISRATKSFTALSKGEASALLKSVLNKQHM